jgi:hypothetical protein
VARSTFGTSTALWGPRWEVMWCDEKWPNVRWWNDEKWPNVTMVRRWEEMRNEVMWCEPNHISWALSFELWALSFELWAHPNLHVRCILETVMDPRAMSHGSVCHVAWIRVLCHMNPCAVSHGSMSQSCTMCREITPKVPWNYHGTIMRAFKLQRVPLKYTVRHKITPWDGEHHFEWWALSSSEYAREVSLRIRTTCIPVLRN